MGLRTPRCVFIALSDKTSIEKWCSRTSHCFKRKQKVIWHRASYNLLCDYYRVLLKKNIHEPKVDCKYTTQLFLPRRWLPVYFLWGPLYSKYQAPWDIVIIWLLSDAKTYSHGKLAAVTPSSRAFRSRNKRVCWFTQETGSGFGSSPSLLDRLDFVYMCILVTDII